MVYQLFEHYWIIYYLNSNTFINQLERTSFGDIIVPNNIYNFIFMILVYDNNIITVITTFNHIKLSYCILNISIHFYNHKLLL